jgi:magnesium-transporting ATPase (P-type)
MSSPHADAVPPERPDPTRVTSQPALRSSTGAVWIIVAAAFTAVCLIPLVAIVGAGGAASVVALVTATLLVIGLVAMVVVRLRARPGPPRLRPLAVCFLAMALVALIGMAVCVMIVWAPLGA